MCVVAKDVHAYIPEFINALKNSTRGLELLNGFSYHTYGNGGSATNGGVGPEGLRNATVLDQMYSASYWKEQLEPIVGEIYNLRPTSGSSATSGVAAGTEPTTGIPADISAHGPARFGLNADVCNLLYSLTQRLMTCAGYITKPSSQTELWIGESASHGGGGTPSVSNRFASLYYYMSTLAATAAANHSGVLRQDLVGAEYGLVEGCASRGKWERYNFETAVSKTPPGTCSPNPDYWGALLFTRLMGPHVMHISTNAPTASVRVWGHCTGAGAASNLTLLLLNLANASTEVDVASAAAGSTLRTDYIMTPGHSSFLKSDPLKTDAVDLNGKPLLMLGPAGTVVPPLTGAVINGSAALRNNVTLPPLAVAFVVASHAHACTHAE